MPRSTIHSPDFGVHPIPCQFFAIAFRGPLPADFSPTDLVTPPPLTIVETLDPEFGAKVQRAFEDSRLRNGWRVQEDGVVVARSPSRFSPVAPAYQAEYDRFMEWLEEETDVEAEIEYCRSRRFLQTRHEADARSNCEAVPSTPNQNLTIVEKIDPDSIYTPSGSPTNPRKRKHSTSNNETDMSTEERWPKRPLSPQYDRKPRKRKIKRCKTLSTIKTETSASQEVYGGNMPCNTEEIPRWCFEQGQYDGPGTNEHNMLAIALH